MKNWLFLLFIIFILFSCKPKKENTEKKITDQQVKSSQSLNEDKNDTEPEIKIEGQVESNTENEPGLSSGTPLILDYEEKISDEPDMTNEILAEFSRLLSGSWTEYPDRVAGKRAVSWGNIPVNNYSYTIIDFIAEQPVYIMGPLEGGPDGEDSLKAEVERIKIEAEGTFRIFYIDRISGLKPRHNNLAFFYDNKNDTISLIDLGGAPSIVKIIQYRVSERLPY